MQPNGVYGYRSASVQQMVGGHSTAAYRTRLRFLIGKEPQRVLDHRDWLLPFLAALRQGPTFRRFRSRAAA